PVHRGEPDPLFSALVIEQAQFDLLGHLGEQGEVGSRAVIGGTERVGVAWPRRHKETPRWAGRPCGRYSGQHRTTPAFSCLVTQARAPTVRGVTNTRISALG